MFDRTRLGATGLLGVGLLIVLMLLLSSGPAPEGVVSVFPVDFGRQAERVGIVQGSVNVRNGSGASIAIVRGAAGCGCVSFDLKDPVVVPAGEAREIGLWLDRERMLHGKVTYPLVIELDDGRRFATRVHYEYVPRVDINPGTLTLTGDGEPVPLEVTISDSDQIDTISSSTETVVIKQDGSQVRRNGQVAWLYWISGTDTSGQGSEAEIVLTLRDGTALRVPVKVLGSNGERLEPSVVLFHPLRSDDPSRIERHILVRHSSIASGTLRVEMPSPLFRVRIESLSEITSRITLSLAPSELWQRHGQEGIEGELRVHCDGTKQPYAVARVIAVP